MDFILSWGCRDLAKIGLATMAKKRKEKKKGKRIRVYQNDLLKKIKLEKRVVACSYGIMEFGTLLS